MRPLIRALALLSVAACTPGADIARYTVEEYRADPDLRRDVLVACTNDPGTTGKSGDCINAIEAERLESRGSLRNLPPVGLDSDRR